MQKAAVVVCGCRRDRSSKCISEANPPHINVVAWINACSLCNKFQKGRAKNQSCDVIHDPMHSQITGGHMLPYIVLSNQWCMGESTMYNTVKLYLVLLN